MLRPPIESAQYLSIRYFQRRADNDVVASVGSKGDSYDNAMAESFNDLYKRGHLPGQPHWRGFDDIELVTLDSVDWFNHGHIHGEILPGHRKLITPAAHEAAYYRQPSTTDQTVTQQPEPPPNRARLRRWGCAVKDVAAKLERGRHTVDETVIDDGEVPLAMTRPALV